MSLRLQVHVDIDAPPAAVWVELTDWGGQSRWIPLTTVRPTSDETTGLGVRVVALSGFWLGRIPVGLLDNFVVTGWTPPTDHTAGELEVLHLGPYFTGEGAFRVETVDGRTRVRATEVFTVPGGLWVEALVRLALPVMRIGFRSSLAALQKVCERPTRPAGPT